VNGCKHVNGEACQAGTDGHRFKCNKETQRKHILEGNGLVKSRQRNSGPEKDKGQESEQRYNDINNHSEFKIKKKKQLLRNGKSINKRRRRGGCRHQWERKHTNLNHQPQDQPRIQVPTPGQQKSHVNVVQKKKGEVVICTVEGQGMELVKSPFWAQNHMVGGLWVGGKKEPHNAGRSFR